MMKSNKHIQKKTNYLDRVEIILNEYKAHKEFDVPTTVIWRKYIRPKYKISLSTLNIYLSMNINKERELINKENEPNN